MKTLWITFPLLAALGGCATGAVDSTPAPVTQQSPATTQAKPLDRRPTVEQYGDSTSLGESGYARLDLYQQVDFRHNAWDRENITPVDRTWFYAAVVDAGQNDGWAQDLVYQMELDLDGRYFTAIVFNSGLHDAQWAAGAPRDPLGSYRNYIETAATLAEQHAAYVIWVDTTPIPANVSPESGMGGAPAGSEAPYNAVADAIAKEHGFYILHLDSRDQLPNNVHYTQEGYRYLGKQIADCVLTVLQGGESASCHR